MDEAKENLIRAGEIFMCTVWLQSQMSDLLILKKNLHLVALLWRRQTEYRPRWQKFVQSIVLAHWELESDYRWSRLWGATALRAHLLNSGLLKNYSD